MEKSASAAMCALVTALVGCGYVGVEVLPAHQEDASVSIETGGATGGAISTGGVAGTGAAIATGGDVTVMEMDAGVDAAVIDENACVVTCDATAYDQVATLSCDVDQCLLDTCESGFGDCDGLLDDGCEVELNTIIDCGGCGVLCVTDSYPQTTAVACDVDQCAPTGCVAGYHDCDGLPGNGCEATFTSAEHCGGCNQPCKASDYDNVAEVSCTGTACILVACQPGFEDCDGLLDNGCEIDLNNDATNCGGCGTVCSGDQAVMACNQGSCEIGSCNAGYDDCDGLLETGCETPLNTLTDCATCGTSCGAAQGTTDCSTGSCQLVSCNAGYDDCDAIFSNGCETPLNTLTDCGACNSVCTVTSGTPSCGGGICTNASCTSPYADCDTDPLTCETNLHTLASCGACNAACGPLPHATATCGTGSCAIANCSTDWGDCDTSAGNGCETSLTTLSNCSTCGTTCSVSNGTASCSTGTCTPTGCSSPYDDCDSDPFTCETNLQTLSNCGACGVSCGPLSHATATCGTGTCGIASCNSGWGNCDGTPGNGCETDVTTTSNCGSCGNVCPNGIECVAGKCQGFRYVPSNFDQTLIDPTVAQDVVFNCGTTTFDSTALTFTNGCGNTLPTPIVHDQLTSGGLQIVILQFSSLQVTSGNTLKLVGNKPVVIAVFGDATIAGTIDSNASGSTAGAGGSQSCGSSTGGNGSGNKDIGGAGGGGAGFATAGGSGGRGGDLLGKVGAGGALRGAASLSPLLAGCSGGTGGGCSSTAGGAGGGAVQLSVGGILTVSGTIRVNGGVGTKGCNRQGGGAGGGSGGGILLEADDLRITGAVTANGGTGGDGTTDDGLNNYGKGGAGGTGTSAAQAGGRSDLKGGGGGGGAVGRARFRGITACNIGGSVSANTSSACP